MIHTTQVVITDPKDAISGYMDSQGNPVFMVGDGFTSRIEFHMPTLGDDDRRAILERVEDVARMLRLQVGVEGRRAS